MQDEMAALMAYRKPLSIWRMQGVDPDDCNTIFDVDHSGNLTIKR